MLRLGTHVSISPTPMQAIEAAREFGLNTIQVFTHNPRGWSFKELDEEVLQRFREALAAEDIAPVVSHCNYLINLATTGEQWRKSLWCLKRELAYARAFGCTYFVLHVGKHKGAGVEQGIQQVIKGLAEAEQESKDSGVTILLETVAGQGTEVGVSFSELAAIIDGAPMQVGVCLDTCHVFAAGKDLRTKEGVDALLAEIEESFGLSRLKLLHLNDSKGALGGHLDRHEHIGRGEIGKRGFAELLSRPQFARLPMILETPWDDRAGDPENLAIVRQLVKN